MNFHETHVGSALCTLANDRRFTAKKIIRRPSFQMLSCQTNPHKSSLSDGFGHLSVGLSGSLWSSLSQSNHHELHVDFMCISQWNHNDFPTWLSVLNGFSKVIMNYQELPIQIIATTVAFKSDDWIIQNWPTFSMKKVPCRLIMILN